MWRPQIGIEAIATFELVHVHIKGLSTRSRVLGGSFQLCDNHDGVCRTCHNFYDSRAIPFRNIPHAVD